MRRCFGAIAVTVLATAAIVPGASAAAPRSAQAFADAFGRANVAASAKKAEVRAAYEALPIATCRKLIERAPRVPARSQERFRLLFALAAFQPLTTSIGPVQHQLLSELEAVATADAALLTLRAQVRRATVELAGRPVLERPCDQIQRWVDADFAAEAAPPATMAALRTALVSPREALRRQRAMDRGFRRLRVLGVPARDLRAATALTRSTGDLLPLDLMRGVFDFTSPGG